MSVQQAMSLRRYLKPRNGLPDPRGDLSSEITPQAIAMVNREVEGALKNGTTSRGPYRK